MGFGTHGMRHHWDIDHSSTRIFKQCLFFYPFPQSLCPVTFFFFLSRHHYHRHILRHILRHRHHSSSPCNLASPCRRRRPFQWIWGCAGKRVWALVYPFMCVALYFGTFGEIRLPNVHVGFGILRFDTLRLRWCWNLRG